MNIPKEILEAASTNDFILFVGSGFSKPLGFLDWNDLAKNAIEEFITDYPKVSILKQCLEKDTMDEILVFDALYKINPDKIETIIQEANNIEFDKNKLKNHELLWDISSRIITTNYDKALESSKPKISIQTICHNYKRELANNFEKPQWLYHIHGIVDDIRNCVIFTKDYVKLYNENNPALEQLKNILQNKTLLFIGFSMKDPYVTDLLEHLNIIFGTKNNNKRFILLKASQEPNQNYLTKIAINDYSEIPKFLTLLRDAIKSYGNKSPKIYRFNRHRCYSFQLGTNEFNTLLNKLLNDPVSTDDKVNDEIDKQINLLQSDYERSIAKAKQYENLGQIEKIVELLKPKSFKSQEEYSRMLYLALALEKLNLISEALEILNRILSKVDLSHEIRLCASFNMSVCYEKNSEFEKVSFLDFFDINDNLQFSKESIRDKAIANHLIVCIITKVDFEYEHLLNAVLENSLKGSPKLYCKTLLNYLTYKNEGVSKEEYDRISDLAKDLSVNSRVGILCEVYMKLDVETQRKTKEEIINKLENIEGLTDISNNERIEEIKKYIDQKFTNS